MYGINEADIVEIDAKIEKQKRFLEENNLSAIGANINPEKYLAELNNRVNALTKFAFERNLKPVFITITLPSEYHPSSKRYNGASFQDANRQLYTIWARLLRSRVLCDAQYDYIQTKEPHKSGVPHLHAVFYIEEKYLDRFKRVFENEMKRQNIKRYEFKTEFKSDKYNRKTSAVVAYILKYIFKTFRNSKTGEMSLAAYWYVKHRIRRVTMSRSLVPLRVFRRINYKKEFQDIYKVSKDWFDGRIREGCTRVNIDYLWSDDDRNVYEDSLWIKPDQLLSNLRKRFKVRYRKKSEPIIPLIIDGVKYYFNTVNQKILQKNIVFPALLSDWKLLNYYRSLDPDNEKISLLHYGVTQNECIRRGLVSMPLQNLNDYNLEI